MDMLKSVHIEGLKSIRDATIDLGALTVLIGANGSGKSNFIPAYRKTLSGVAATRAIGIDRMRETCPHFSEWIQRLIALGE